MREKLCHDSAVFALADQPYRWDVRVNLRHALMNSANLPDNVGPDISLYSTTFVCAERVKNPVLCYRRDLVAFYCTPNVHVA